MKINNHHLKAAAHLLQNRKSLGTMLKEVWKGNYKMGFYTYLLLTLTIIYTISPIDLLPDFIPVIGWIDDGILLFLAFQQLKKELAKYNEQQTITDVVILDSKMKK